MTSIDQSKIIEELKKTNAGLRQEIQFSDARKLKIENEGLKNMQTQLVEEMKTQVDENEELDRAIAELRADAAVLTVEDVAQICHEVNKAYCESQGDASQLPWVDAPEWQRESAVNGVNYHLAHPDSKPSDSHSSWLKEKTDAGWMYGEVKDPENLIHPCMVPFEELPLDQQAKDFIFLTIVRSTMNFMDLTHLDPGYDEAIDSQDGAEGAGVGGPVEEAVKTEEQTTKDELLGDPEND